MSEINLPEVVFIKSGKVYKQIKIDEVLYIFAEGNYTTFFTSSGKHVAKISLRQVGEIISPVTFIRVHRNYMVRIDKIEKIDVQNNKIHLAERIIPIGKSFRKDLLEQIRILG